MYEGADVGEQGASREVGCKNIQSVRCNQASTWMCDMSYAMCVVLQPSEVGLDRRSLRGLAIGQVN